MTTVADLIDLLAARRKGSLLHDRRTGFPYSWSAWLRGGSPAKALAFAGADAAAAAPAWNGPRSRGSGRATSFPHALLQVLRWAGDDPPAGDQRRLRWFSAVCSVALHLLFAVLLVWVALVRSNVPEPGTDAGERVRIEYMGRGTPEDPGGGAPQAAGASATTVQGAAGSAVAAAASPQSRSRPQSAAQDSSAGSASDAAPADVPQPASATEAPQPLQVTEVPRPTGDFVLPPATVAAPALRVQAPQVRERTVETLLERPTQVRELPVPDVATRAPAMPQVQVRERPVETGPVQPVAMAQVRPREAQVRLTGAPAVRERQIEAAPRQQVTMATVPARDSGVQVTTADLAVRERQIPGVADAVAVPAAGSGAAAPINQGAAAQASQGAAAGGQGTKSAPQPGTSTGAGPRSQDRSGGWAAPVRSDDWGASQRQASGGSGAASDAGRGLYNSDGSVRLAGDAGKDAAPAGRGAPGGGSDSWSREQIDRAGTWLKRPPYDHAPTSFDKYWVPNESLLAEWVRKGVKSIEIPIPGTGTRISCVVSILQFGGGCGLSNPNMQEQPASARPPPDVPFKQELQEDNGSR
ncbi:hypothetical protein EM864_00565 [Stenotrophomonas acidaminiphila]|uniref:hypothetical protein n=1 Tax=Stenotrophomonas acidaminiphila TaxID=128780 RepID=UPI0024073D47|nr:hypothetical protein [Stenotrophomonas acidaminiphila]MDF9440243.1 hypothetical protein [Stenotrophomonas acidaminiphila]